MIRRPAVLAAVMVVAAGCGSSDEPITRESDEPFTGEPVRIGTTGMTVDDEGRPAIVIKVCEEGVDKLEFYGGPVVSAAQGSTIYSLPEPRDGLVTFVLDDPGADDWSPAISFDVGEDDVYAVAAYGGGGRFETDWLKLESGDVEHLGDDPEIVWISDREDEEGELVGDSKEEFERSGFDAC